MPNPFILSLEPLPPPGAPIGAIVPAIRHGFHLGTDPVVARQIAEERFNAEPRAWRTVALMLDGRVYDVYDGTWASESHYAHFDHVDVEEIAETSDA